MRKGYFFLNAVLLFALLVNLCLSKAHSGMLPASLEDLVNTSQVIVIGTVQNGGISAAFNAEQTTIFSTVLVSVEDVIKDQVGISSVVSVRVEGGQVGGTAIGVEDAPIFAEGEKVFLFLQQSGSVLTAVADSQGKFAVVQVDGIFRVVRGNSDFGILQDFKNLIIQIL